MSRSGASLQFLLLAGVLWLAACSNNDEARANKEAASQVANGNAASPVLAVVDGTSITEFEVEQAMERLFSGQKELRNRDHVAQQILKSLISSRAISRLAEKELAPADRQALDARVAAFREELLVKNYLQAHAEPQPISTEMVEAYYREHEDEFGGGLSSSFEVIRSNRELKEDERRDLIKLFGTLSAEKNWKKWAQQHAASPIVWRQLSARSELLEQPLRGLVEATAAGATSALHVGEQLTIVRVNAKEQLSPRPLAQVSVDIRRKLAPIKMKEAIKAISDSAEKQMKIEFINPGDQGSINN